ncbi:MAG: N-acetylmuramoyl-L-alanine amidase [Cyanobacteria bacterium P01_H01_bin.121]
MKYTRKLLLTLLTLSSWGFLAGAVDAGELANWRFDRDRNRLEFSTTENVQPRAQLIANPTRIVIDLPGTTLGRSMVTETLGGTVRNLRVGQFDQSTTRLVLELAPGYTVDPSQVKVQGISGNRWVVEVPDPQRVGSTPTPTPTPTPTSPTVDAPTQITSVQETPDGLFIRTAGATPQITLRSSRNRRELTLDIANAAAAANLLGRSLQLPQLGIERLEVTQADTDPPTVRLSLNVRADATDWQASVSNLGGVILIPQRTGVTPPSRPTPTPQPTPTPAQQAPAQVQAVGFSPGQDQLIIQTDRPTNFSGGWQSGEYRIRLSPAQVAARVQGPPLDSSSPLLRVRVRQVADQEVLIQLQPARGVQLGSLQAINPQQIALPLLRTQAIPPPIQPGPQPQPIPPRPQPGPVRPSIPQGRPVVVIDPGHGGPDPGAVGIGGLQEKNVVLPISLRVASLLQQQGVQVVMTRGQDIDLGLEPRVQIAERVNATVFVSIHANAISLARPDVNGVETYFYGSAAGQRLASSIHSSMLRNVPLRDRRVREARFYVIRRTSMPAALVEVGFVTGAEDAPRLAQPAFREQISNAIAQGILNYLQGR